MRNKIKAIPHTQCLDNNGIKGCFIRDENGTKLTNTYPDNLTLIESDEYQKLKLTHDISIKHVKI